MSFNGRRLAVDSWRLAVGGFLAAIALVCFASPCLASGHKVVVVVANRVLLSDLQNDTLPTISKMLADGAPGLVSPNCVGFKSEYSVIATAAAGAACRGGSYVADCFDASEVLPDGEPAGTAFYTRTGIYPHEDSAVFLGVARASRDNLRIGGFAGAGTLADALHASGKRTCAIGNADLPPEVYDRSAAVLAADSHGRIDFGLLASPGTDRLADAALDALRLADLVVVNFGETTQLDELKISISDKTFAASWATALSNLDSLLGILTTYAEKHDAGVVLVSFSPPSEGPWMELTPIVVYPSSSGGLLTSSTTRTLGLVAASDFAATILDLMDVPPPAGLMGRAARETPTGAKLAALDTLSQRVTAKRILELPMLWTIAIIGIISCTLSAIAAGFGVLGWARKAVRIGLLIGAACPLAMLVASPAPSGAMGYATATGLALIFVLAIAWRAGDRAVKRSVVEGRPYPHAVPVVVIFWATAACIVIDSAFGGTLCKYSLPSSFQISGFRYYGIGNEYAGALISMTALALLFSGKSFRRRAAVPIGVLAAIFLGAGALGANYGATLAAVITFGLLWTASRRGSFRGRQVILWCVIAVVVAVAFAVADWKLFVGHGTHAGQTGAAANAVGGGYWTDLIERKVIMNLKLTFSNTAEKAILGFAPFVGLWFWKVTKKVKLLFGEDKSIIWGIRALMVGSVVAYAANDSGVVMASIMVAMTVAILLYSLLEEGARHWAES